MGNVKYTQLTTHLIALIVVVAVIIMYGRGLEPPGELLGAFGMVIGIYVRRQTEQDVHDNTERVLGTQVAVNEPAQVR